MDLNPCKCRNRIILYYGIKFSNIFSKHVLLILCKKGGEILGKCIEGITYVQLNKMEEKYVPFHFLTKKNEIPLYILYHIPAREVESLNVSADLFGDI